MKLFGRFQAPKPDEGLVFHYLPPPPKVKRAYVRMKDGDRYSLDVYKVEHAEPCFVVLTGPGYERWLRQIDVGSIEVKECHDK
jgi:hypothetical protein